MNSKVQATLKLFRLRAGVLVTALSLWAGPLSATPPSGFTSETYRGRITTDVGAQQWDPNPLFNVLIQSSSDPWGYDVVQGTSTFAPADASGTPSQSGWHDHPTALSVGLVIQGTVWSQEADNPKCLQPIPTGSVFFERSGHMHNNFNIDPKTPAVVRIIHFLDRNQSATRRDQPDPVSGSATTATPAPPVCQPGSAASTGAVPAESQAHGPFPPTGVHQQDGQGGAQIPLR